MWPFGKIVNCARCNTIGAKKSLNFWPCKEIAMQPLFWIGDSGRCNAWADSWCMSQGILREELHHLQSKSHKLRMYHQHFHLLQFLRCCSTQVSNKIGWTIGGYGCRSIFHLSAWEETSYSSCSSNTALKYIVFRRVISIILTLSDVLVWPISDYDSVNHSYRLIWNPQAVENRFTILL